MSDTAEVRDGVTRICRRPDHAHDLVEFGVLGLGVDPARGGVGGTFADLVAAFEACGAALSPAPLLGRAAAVRVLVAAGGDDLLLARACNGAAAVALACGWSTPDLASAGQVVSARSSGSQWSLAGKIPLAFDVTGTDRLVLFARAGSADALFSVRTADVELLDARTPDETRALVDVVLHDVPAEPLPFHASIMRAFDEIPLLICADALGGADTLLAKTVDYARTRHQFGRPIGSFQAVQHRCADMAVAVERSRAALRAAVDAVAGRTSATVAVQVAKAVCGTVYRDIAEQAIQIFGGIGFTWEHEAHRFLKRAMLDRLFGGDPDEFAERAFRDHSGTPLELGIVSEIEREPR